MRVSVSGGSERPDRSVKLVGWEGDTLGWNLLAIVRDRPRRDVEQRQRRGESRSAGLLNGIGGGADAHCSLEMASTVVGRLRESESGRSGSGSI